MGSNFAKRRCAVMLIIAVLYVVTLLAFPYFMHSDPNTTDLSSTYLAPGEQGHLLGTDSVGRDVLLRTLAGGSESLTMSLLSVVLSFFIGIVVGLAAGFIGGAVDEVLDKVITMFQAFPSFVLAIAIAAILGQGMTNMIIAIAAVYWTQPARLARSLAMRLKTSDMVKAARVCGSSVKDICIKYLLPATAGPLIVMATLSVGDIVLTMAGLSFIGLGPERPTNEWGAMMTDARTSFQYAPWEIIVPGVALFITVIIFNLLGDSLRDMLDVDTRQAEDVGRNKKDKQAKTRERQGKHGNQQKDVRQDGGCDRRYRDLGRASRLQFRRVKRRLG